MKLWISKVVCALALDLIPYNITRGLTVGREAYTLFTNSVRGQVALPGKRLFVFSAAREPCVFDLPGLFGSNSTPKRPPRRSHECTIVLHYSDAVVGWHSGSLAVPETLPKLKQQQSQFSLLHRLHCQTLLVECCLLMRLFESLSSPCTMMSCRGQGMW